MRGQIMIEMKIEGQVLLNDTTSKRSILTLDCVVYRNQQEIGRVNLESRVSEGALYEKLVGEENRKAYIEEWKKGLDEKIQAFVKQIQQESNLTTEKIK